MKKQSLIPSLIFTVVISLITIDAKAQPTPSYYDVSSIAGNGFRFWNGDDNYKIHMGNTTNYHYGPVDSYSIKMNMNGDVRRGWTWGVINTPPIAALNTEGKLQISGSFKSLYFETHGTGYSKTEITEHSWSGSHGVLFNAYKKIDVSGSLSETGNTKYANNEGAYSGGAGAIMFMGNGGTMHFMVSPESSGKDTDVNWGTPKMTIKRDGSVGIGKLSPTAKLHVDGIIISEEIKVENVDGADFVFAADYNLMPLSETEAYIKANHHLPEVPSAAEMQANGVELGKMNMLLLQKIEELTLHQIEMNKLLVEQQKQLEVQNQKIANLENILK